MNVKALERQAVELLDRMGLRGHHAASMFIGDIVTALRAARAEVWDEAAQSHSDKDGTPCAYCLTKAAALKEGV